MIRTNLFTLIIIDKTQRACPSFYQCHRWWRRHLATAGKIDNWV